MLPAAIVAVVAMFPDPDGAPQLDAPEEEQVHVAPVMVAGIVSAIVAAVAVDGPAFCTVMVYVTAVPGTSVVAPSVLVMLRSPVGESVSVSLAELFAEFVSETPDGTVMVAVLVTLPVAVARMVAVTVNVAVPPTARFTATENDPDPEAVAQLEPAEAAQTHDAALMFAGMTSATVAPLTGFGPLLLAMIV